ncbi:MAG: DUF1501 domain-containing protein [Aureliella sp.]
MDISVSRRQMLQTSGAGFGMLSLAGLLGQQATAASGPGPATGLHHQPRAKRVIFLFMNGGPSHVDTFDPKPMLAKHAEEMPASMEGRKIKAGYMPSPFRFRSHGESGNVMSELLPNLARCADDLCIIRSMHTDVPNHEPGLLLMNSGHQQPTRPSLGSWVSYGLGTENQNLPGFVVLCPGLPVVGPQLWNSAFLPGEFQGTAVNTNDMQVDRLLANLRHPKLSRTEQKQQLDLLKRVNQLHLAARDTDPALESQIRALELAFQMQREASDVFDISREPEAVRREYGETTFGRSCLLARRLIEGGVRFVQVYYISDKDKQPWDTHASNNTKHQRLCADSDRASAALINDLKARGLLEDTLVVWGGEFGRTPYAQIDKNTKEPGRDHHNTAFSMFLAGGGTRAGTTFGASDEFGMHAIEDRVHIHDLHATILHLLGIDHQRLTFRYSGRDYRLTDVSGKVVQGILA